MCLSLSNLRFLLQNSKPFANVSTYLTRPNFIQISFRIRCTGVEPLQNKFLRDSHYITHWSGYPAQHIYINIQISQLVRINKFSCPIKTSTQSQTLFTLHSTRSTAGYIVPLQMMCTIYNDNLVSVDTFNTNY